MVPSDRSVTIAVGHGKHAACHIDAYLKGGKYTRGPRHPVIGHEKLHLWFRTHAPKVEQERLPIVEWARTEDDLEDIFLKTTKGRLQ